MTMATQPAETASGNRSPTRFSPLSVEGINPVVVDNPVMRMLIEEDQGLAEGRRCSISPDDEWLIFLD